MTPTGTPQKRGAELRRHILVTAKNVFLETGYERASMDTVAARAGTSKRSLYAHFANKEALLTAVLDLVRELYLDRLGVPGDYADEPAEAVTLFCARFQQLMVWESQVRTARLVISVAERLPGSSDAYYTAVFGSAQDRLAAYLGACWELADAVTLAEDLLGRTVLPRVFRALLGTDAPVDRTPEPGALAEDVDLDTIRRQVTAALPLGATGNAGERRA